MTRRRRGGGGEDGGSERDKDVRPCNRRLIAVQQSHCWSLQAVRQEESDASGNVELFSTPLYTCSVLYTTLICKL